MSLPSTLVLSGAALFSPDIPILISIIFRNMIGEKRILERGSGIRSTIFLLLENSAKREFTLLEDNEESGSESQFTEVDIDYPNDLTESDSELESD